MSVNASVRCPEMRFNRAWLGKAYVTIEIGNVNSTEFDYSLVQRSLSTLRGGREHP